MGTETTFAGLIAAPQSEKVFLCEAKPGEQVTNFAAATAVTLAGLTCNLSTVNGTAFITNPSVDLTPYIGWKITITAGGKTLVGWVKAAGTGETTGSELVGGWSSPGTWTTFTVNANGHDIDSAIYTGAGYSENDSANISLSTGALAKFGWSATRISGSMNTIGLINPNIIKQSWSATIPLTTTYFTKPSGNTFVAVKANPDNPNWAATFSVLQVLTPSSTGVTIVSAQGGSTYNWTSNDGIDPNAASFTVTLELPQTYQLSYLNETVTISDASTETTRKAAVSCEVDGVALTTQASIAAVDANAGSYWHDTANGLFYIHAPDNGSPNHHTVIVYFWVYFATKGIVLDGRYYEPYIASDGIPAITQETQQIHWGASQISSGSVKMINSRGFFDQITKRWIWNNKDIRLLLGGDALPYSEYTSIFAGRIMQATFTKTSFTLDIESKAFALLRSLPINSYWKSTWPNLESAAEGKAIPYFWGVYDVTQAPLCTCINTAYAATTYQFKICDCTYHAIRSITQAYVDYGAGAGWQTIAHGNEDLTNGTFTINAASFVVGTSKVKAALEGYHVGGVLIEGAPEIAEDILLNQCGYAAADLNAASFIASKAISDCALNVPVESVASALTIIETICQSDLAFFDEDGAGLLRYRTWEPSTIGTLPVLAKEDILAEPEIIEDSSQLYWKVKAGYSYQCAAATCLYTESSNDESKYKYGRDDYLTINTYHRTKAGADTITGRINWVTRNPSPVITLQLKAGQIDKNLGDKIKVTLARAPQQAAGGYDERVFEIISKEVSCFPLMVTVRGRDLMDYGANVGFIMADTAPDWATATVQERDDSGFWCDDDGLCLTSDPTSLNKSLWW